MKVLFISRKKSDGYGGLSRFYTELSANFPSIHYNLSPQSLATFLKLPYLRLTHIYLCDATLLPLGVLLKSILNKPLIVTAHGLDLTFTNPLYQMLLRWLLPKTDAIVLDSNPAKSLLDGFNLSQPVEIINPGVSIKHLRKSKAFSLPNLGGKIALATVGNLVKRKGHGWFIENVFTKLPKGFIYLIVGDGPERNSILKMIKKFHLKKRVFLLGRLTNPQLSFVLKNTDIYVCPNQKTKQNFESFSIATAEAAALGLPVVASRVDGIPEAIRHGKNGLLVSPNAFSFINTLTQLNSKKRQLLSSKARAFTLKYHSWNKAIQKYLKVFQTFSLISS